MKLITNPDSRILNNQEIITSDCLCYGKRNDGKITWCYPGSLTDTKWNKYSINSPSIVIKIEKDN